MTDAIDTYAATLREVARQAAALRATSSGGSGGGSAALGGASSAVLSGSGSGSDWVVLESASTPAALPTAAGCSVWPPQQWQVAYELLFCQCPPAVAALRPHAADDMLFFVYTDEAAAAACARLFVRRRQARAAALPADLAAAGPGAGAAAGAAASRVDWRASVLLMVVLQTAYRLSVVTAADPELLAAALDGAQPAARSGVSHITKTVHASPSHVPVNLDQSRSEAGRPQACYPDVCFAVDNCDEAFQSQVLRLPHDCYAVLLHADVQHSWSLPASQAAGSGGGPPEAASAADPHAAAAAAAAADMASLSLSQQQRSTADSAGGSAGQLRSGGASEESVAVFSGFVSHAQLTAALGGQLFGDSVRQVLRAAATAARGPQAGDRPQPLATCRVSMRGPGGVGAADVAVSSFEPAADAGHLGSAAAAAAAGAPVPAPGGSSPGRPPSKLLAQAQAVARGVVAAAKQAAAPPPPGVPLDKLHLRCALMALQVPVDTLAAAVLEGI